MTRVSYTPGKFLPAYRAEAASQNERNEIWIEHGGQTIICRQVVGLLARRILCRIGEGAEVTAGQRYGIMKFGSRMDLYLPPDTTLMVRVGRTASAAAKRHWPAGRRPGEPMMDQGPGPRPLRVAPSPRPAEHASARRPRRGVALLPSLFTLGNLFCGYACVIYAMRGEFDTAAPFISIAVILDMLDGRIARLTGTASEFGVQFDSMADIISFGMAPAVLTFAWGLSTLGRLGSPDDVPLRHGSRAALARFNIQAASADKRYSWACRARPPRASSPRLSMRIRKGSCSSGRRCRRSCSS